MTSYEVRWCNWLRRELAKEFGMPLPRTGRLPVLQSNDKAALYAAISTTRHKRRGAVYGRFSKELRVGISTLQNAMTLMWRERGVMCPRGYVVEPENIENVEPENFALGET